MKRRLFTIALACGVALGVGALSGCGEPAPIPYTVDLEIWGVFDDTNAYAKSISEFQSINQSHIGQITYRKLPIETYKEDLLRAFAEGKGPDVFMIRNSWIPAFSDMIVPAPEYQVNEKEFRDAFVDVAAEDLIANGKIYGAPLSVDSLALYYNKDLFNAAGIANPPSTWDEFVSDSKLLTRIDEYGNITQSGAALGTVQNINRSTDILTALGFQLGARGAQGENFSSRFELSSSPMVNAVDFYTQFSRVGADRYAWNQRQHYSLDAFYEGTLGMMVNYSWHADTLRRKNAKLNFGVAPLPQFSGSEPSNFANYWFFVVAKNKFPPEGGANAATYPAGKYNDLRIHESWQFLHYLAFPHPGTAVTLRNPLSQLSADRPISGDPALRYLEETRKPAARRDLIEAQKKDTWLSPFAYGNLIAKSLRSVDMERVEAILAAAIDSVILGERPADEALGLANTQAQLVERKK